MALFAARLERAAPADALRHAGAAPLRWISLCGAGSPERGVKLRTLPHNAREPA